MHWQVKRYRLHLMVTDSKIKALSSAPDCNGLTSKALSFATDCNEQTSKALLSESDFNRHTSKRSRPHLIVTEDKYSVIVHT